jgi:hypothetical protein
VVIGAALATYLIAAAVGTTTVTGFCLLSVISALSSGVT